MKRRTLFYCGITASVGAILIAWTSFSTLNHLPTAVGGETLTSATPQVGGDQFIKPVGVALSAHNRLEPPLSTPLDHEKGVQSTYALPSGSTKNATLQSLRLDLETSRSFYVHDQGLTWETQGQAVTVGEALAKAGVELRRGDVTRPGLNDPLISGGHVYVVRARKVDLEIAGKTLSLYTQAATVAAALAQAKVHLTSHDLVEPPLGTPLDHDLTVRITRINEERVTINEPIPYRTEYVADNSIVIGDQRFVQAGIPGQLKRIEYIRYVNGQEVKRTVVNGWIDVLPQTRIVHYGTKAVFRVLETADGPVEYWKKMRVWATWYNAASSGKPLGHPAYGITRSGLQLKKGIVAVDPRVIPLLTNLYIPDYGYALAADTGGGIIGKWVDMGFADHETPTWITGWADIYFLEPAPNPADIPPPIS